MRYRIVIDGEIEEDVLIYAKNRSDTLLRLEELLKDESAELIGFCENGDAVPISAFEIMCVTVEDGRVFALTQNERLRMRLRLYQLEECLGEQFIKINQSCIVRISAIERFETSFSGALNVRLKNGFMDYVSRRQMKTVKERLGF